jgi:hypothetical protein
MTARALAALFCLSAGLAAHARISLVTLPARENVRIRIDRNNNALVQEERRLTVLEGLNRVEFGWQNLAVDADTVQLAPLADEAISVLSTATSPTAPNTLVIEAQSDRAAEMPLRITYMTRGIAWTCEYTALLGDDERRATLEAVVTLHNATVEDYDDAEVELPVGDPFRLTIRSGESRKVTLFREENIPLEKAYTWGVGTFDSVEQYDRSVVGHYVFRNDAGHGLGEDVLLPGKVRVLKREASGSLSLLGEDIVPFLPIGAEARLFLGRVHDIEVEPRAVRRNRANVVQNKQKQDVLYDTEEDYAVAIRNHKAEEAPLLVRVRLNRAHWEMRSTSDPFEREEAFALAFRATVPARGQKEVTFGLRGRNLQSGFVLDW